MVEVCLGETGVWVADIASPSLDIGSTVAYFLVEGSSEERRMWGRMEEARRVVDVRRAAIVGGTEG